jgi:MFS family permease
MLWGAEVKSFGIFLAGAGLAGLCTGMQFPLIATITADYYGETTNAQNYGVVYSAKIPGGIAGGVLGAAVITHLGYNTTFVISAILAVLAVLMTYTHRQPSLQQYERIAARGGVTRPGVSEAPVPETGHYLYELRLPLAPYRFEWRNEAAVDAEKYAGNGYVEERYRHADGTATVIREYHEDGSYRIMSDRGQIELIDNANDPFAPDPVNVVLLP